MLDDVVSTFFFAAVIFEGLGASACVCIFVGVPIIFGRWVENVATLIIGISGEFECRVA